MAKRQKIQWPKDRKYNGQKKKDKKTNNGQQNAACKTKNTGMNSDAPGKIQG
jgi:hypothetical protein